MSVSSDAALPEQSAENRRRRPVLTWIILIYYLIAAVGSIIMIGGALASATPRLDAQGKPYTAFDYVESFVFTALRVAAAVMLFRLSRMALKLFGATLILNVIATSYDLATKGLPPPGGPIVIVAVLIGFGILAGICTYAWHLQRRGILV